ncbi:DNA cytosine methyltransferase [Acidaminococcus fermentans]|jgi:DNA (cytosine-5)-methyltransferase 1|uniref:Cytosine-specific methyltransferase n=1 Tax=Acidaminococcus fermentans TaxID=905 RepID=A0A6N7W1G8_ACIFE|nr:DNA cytosine methyltransferase [Acidaminococcus fermentans]MSS83135.1 DNA cytosine methyltransferase [Acidaminococcus fermentans]
MTRYLDLFAGAGGLSEGFKMAGFDPVAHVEMDQAACNTLRTRVAYYWLKDHDMLSVYDAYLKGEISRRNFYGKIPAEELNSVLEYTISQNNIQDIFSVVHDRLHGNKLDLIIGGPPCQAYSLAGRARSRDHMVGDARNYLYKLYAEFLREFQPRYFVFENVVGLLSAKERGGERYFDKMRLLFKDYGYTTEYRILNAHDYGVLQNRKRIILIGKLNGEHGFYPLIPKTDTSAYRVHDILDDLPFIHSGEGIPGPVATKNHASSYLFKVKIKEYQTEPVTEHYSRPNNEQDLKIYRIAVQKWNESHDRLSYRELPTELRSHKNITAFLDRFKVVAGDLPFSHTVVAHLSKDGHYYIHPDIRQNRSITPREAARIQTFPDNFYFEGNSARGSQTQAYKQIGNAVPVYLAYSIAQAMKSCFENPEGYQRDREESRKDGVEENLFSNQVNTHYKDPT